MALTDDDLKKIGKLVAVGIGEALDEAVLPSLLKIEKRLDGVESRLDKVEEKMATKDDIARLEKKIDIVAAIATDTRTNHERRIRKIEDKVGIRPTRVLN